MPDRRTATVTDAQAGQRLDRALTELLEGGSRSFYARLIEEGNISIDGRIAAKSSEKVESGQVLVALLPDPQPSELPAQDIPFVVLHDDPDLIVIDKPAGLVVHPAAGHADGTLVNALLFHVSDLSGVGGEIRPGIVHRLDKDTSGVMIIAKNDETHRALTAAWNTPRVVKEYLAVVYGTPADARGVIEAPIGRDPHDRKRMAIVADGRQAITEWELVGRYRGISTIRCRLRTGRTHQIRVHMKHLGHPIVGDPVYSGPQWRNIPDKKLQRAVAAFPRQALHAMRITFTHPRSGETVTIEAPLPEDLVVLMDALRAE